LATERQLIRQLACAGYPPALRMDSAGFTPLLD